MSEKIATVPVQRVWDKPPRWEFGLLPAIVQDVHTGQVLMLAYMNDESLRLTLETGRTWFWSRSRRKLWRKGDTSGNVQHVREVRMDCDGDTLLVLVEQVGAACHEGTHSCFAHLMPGSPRVPAERSYFPNSQTAVQGIGPVLEELATVLSERHQNPNPQSYTAGLFAKAPDAALKKVAEEAGEVLLAAKGGDRAGLVWEMADLWFHSLVVLEQAGISIHEVAAELAQRRGKRRPRGGPATDG